MTGHEPLGVADGAEGVYEGPLVTITIAISCYALMGRPRGALICQRASGWLLMDFDPVAFLGCWAPYLIWELGLHGAGWGRSWKKQPELHLAQAVVITR